jgi:hypothetical protein
MGKRGPERLADIFRKKFSLAETSNRDGMLSRGFTFWLDHQNVSSEWFQMILVKNILGLWKPKQRNGRRHRLQSSSKILLKLK